MTNTQTLYSIEIKGKNNEYFSDDSGLHETFEDAVLEAENIESMPEKYFGYQIISNEFYVDEDGDWVTTDNYEVVEVVNFKRGE